MNVSEAGRVRNDGIGHKGQVGIISWQILGRVEGIAFGVRLWRGTETISSFNTRPPAAKEHSRNPFTAFANFTALDSIESRHEARMLDHEGHQLGWVSSNTEKLEPILLDKTLEGRVGCDAHAMTVRVLQDLAKGDEGLDVATGTDNLNHDVELWRRDLARLATQARGNVTGR